MPFGPNSRGNRAAHQANRAGAPIVSCEHVAVARGDLERVIVTMTLRGKSRQRCRFMFEKQTQTTLRHWPDCTCRRSTRPIEAAYGWRDLHTLVARCSAA